MSDGLAIAVRMLALRLDVLSLGLSLHRQERPMRIDIQPLLVVIDEIGKEAAVLQARVAAMEASVDADADANTVDIARLAVALAGVVAAVQPRPTPDAAPVVPEPGADGAEPVTA